jgi:hypothetical protein
VGPGACWGWAAAQLLSACPQSVENCMCILHNLSYRLDAEVPTRYRQLEYNTRNTYTEKSSTGCFSNRGDKMMVSTVHQQSRGPLHQAPPDPWPAHPFLSALPEPESSLRGQAPTKALALGVCHPLSGSGRRTPSYMQRGSVFLGQ